MLSRLAFLIPRLSYLKLQVQHDEVLGEQHASRLSHNGLSRCAELRSRRGMCCAVASDRQWEYYISIQIASTNIQAGNVHTHVFNV